jgi:Inovirus Coat protein B
MNKFFNAGKALVARGCGKALVVASGVGLAGAAHAQTSGTTVDVSSVVSTIHGGLAAIAAIGLAVLGVYGAIAIYNWVKRPIK